jgi:hypothetical protein
MLAIGQPVRYRGSAAFPGVLRAQPVSRQIPARRPCAHLMPFSPGANWSRTAMSSPRAVNAEEEQSSAKACAQSGPHYRFLTLEPGVLVSPCPRRSKLLLEEALHHDGVSLGYCPAFFRLIIGERSAPSNGESVRTAATLGTHDIMPQSEDSMARGSRQGSTIHRLGAVN